MTIPTTLNVVSDPKKKGVVEESVYVTVDGGVPPVKTPKAKVVPVARRKNQKCLKICLILLILTGLASAGMGSFYLYKSFHFNKRSYKGTCSLPVYSSPSSNLTLKEDVDVTSDLEVIRVPKFDNNDEATFIHDFKQEISVIKDVTDKVCYLLPLDTSVIPPPETFLDVLFGITSGQYILDADKIRSGYVVEHPAIPNEDVAKLYGDYIHAQCADYKTFKLAEIDESAATTTTMAAFVLQRTFVMYPGGSVLIQYYIYI